MFITVFYHQDRCWCCCWWDQQKGAINYTIKNWTSPQTCHPYPLFYFALDVHIYKFSIVFVQSMWYDNKWFWEILFFLHFMLERGSEISPIIYKHFLSLMQLIWLTREFPIVLANGTFHFCGNCPRISQRHTVYIGHC